MNPPIRLVAIEFNPTIGDLAGNTARILAYIAQYASPETILVFPELALTGYPPQDLLLDPAFLTACTAHCKKIAQKVTSGAAILGAPMQKSHSCYNAALVLEKGTITHAVAKTLLPNYDVFDEKRYFSPQSPPATHNMVQVLGKLVMLLICKDIWLAECLTEKQASPYVQQTKRLLQPPPCDLIVTLAASPYTQTKLAHRLYFTQKLATAKQTPLLYVNQSGSNDALIFDGRTFLLSANGNLTYLSPGFNEHVTTFTLAPVRHAANATLVPIPVPPNLKIPPTLMPLCTPLAIPHQALATFPTLPLHPHFATVAPHPEPNLAQRLIAENKLAHAPAKKDKNHTSTPPYDPTPYDLNALFHALVLGIRDYARKTGFQRAIIGLSGGIDSALTAVMATAALGLANVRTLALPSRYSSAHAERDAAALAHNLGIAHSVFSIDNTFSLLKTELKHPLDLAELHGPTAQNLQARLRALVLMAISNQENRLLLATGNKSELAVGYTTLYGDMCGALAVIGDLFKTEVYRLAHFINNSASAPIIPPNILTKPPSAELKPQQKDSDSLPPYHVLDAILKQFLLAHHNKKDLSASNFNPATIEKVLKLVKNSEYKRFQAPPVLKVSEKAFGSGRRIPIAKI